MSAELDIEALMKRDRNGRYTVVLGKEDFKFSCAHFTVFGPEEAEPLHGHNYQVRVEVEGARLDDLGLLVDFDRIKREVRRLCDELDSLMLIPERCALIEIRRSNGVVDVDFARRAYRFPEQDVLILPLVNTTVELFARYFWERLAPGLGDTAGESLAVDVAETAGQSCVYRAPLTGAQARDRGAAG